MDKSRDRQFFEVQLDFVIEAAVKRKTSRNGEERVAWAGAYRDRRARLLEMASDLKRAGLISVDLLY